MPLEFSCPQCGKLLKTSGDKAGQSAPCPECGTSVEVPELGDLACPRCGRQIPAAAELCRFCGESFEGSLADAMGFRPTPVGIGEIMIMSRSWELLSRHGLMLGAGMLLFNMAATIVHLVCQAIVMGAMFASGGMQQGQRPPMGMLFGVGILVGYAIAIPLASYLFLRVIPVAFCTVDRDLGVFAAFAASFQLLSRNFWTDLVILFLMYAVLWLIPSVCCLPGIFTMPLYAAMQTVAYVLMCGRRVRIAG